MAELARDHGYNISLAQAESMFDLLDTERLGKIPKGDLMKYLWPLLQWETKRTLDDGGVTDTRKKADVKKPRRPRPSGPPPAAHTPPRPSGEP
ncbi:unnamed protein product, partial [Sphacelaria rigidula]